MTARLAGLASGTVLVLATSCLVPIGDPDSEGSAGSGGSADGGIDARADGSPGPDAPIAQPDGSCVCASGVCCDGCQYRPPTHVCHPPAGECDLADTCSGSSADCPPDETVPNGAECTGGTCQDGVCQLGGADITTGLMAHWKLDEKAGTTAADSAGVHTGTLTNGPVWIAGRINGGLDFDGSDDHVNTAETSVLSMTGAISVAAWVRADASATGRIVSKSGGTSARGWEMKLEGGEPVFQISSTCTDVGVVQAWGSSQSVTGSWLHYVGVYEPGKALRIYANGTLSGSQQTGIAAVQCDAGNPIYIGGRASCTNCYLDASIDDVRMYNRALSAEEVTALYNWKGD